MKISPPKGFKLLAGNQLLRYGESNRLFCHLKSTNLNESQYVEPYCPCDITSPDCYIVPISTEHRIFIHTNDTNEFQSTKSLRNLDEKNVFYIAGYQLSVTKTANLNIHLDTAEPTEVEFQQLEKKTFVSSTNGFTVGSTLCSSGFFSDEFRCSKLLKCLNGDSFDSITQKCYICDDVNCVTCIKDKNLVDKCVLCKDGYVHIDGVCVKDPHCLVNRLSDCIKCEDGYINYRGRCKEPDDNCQTRNNDNTCQMCTSSSNTVNVNGKCVPISDYVVMRGDSSIIYCQKGYFVLNETFCEKCDNHFGNCDECIGEQCTVCKMNYEFDLNGNCVLKTCKNSINTAIDNNGKCLLPIEHCILYKNEKCVNCDEGYMLESFNKCVVPDLTTCITPNTTGCLRCKDGMYVDNELKCSDCDPMCPTCKNSPDFCLTCPDKRFLKNNKCLSNAELEAVCKVMSLGGDRCYECQDGFYLKDQQCQRCDEQCGSCKIPHICLTCNETNFMNDQNQCVPQSLIYGCSVAITQRGCTQCEEGYHTYKSNQCQKCTDKCIRCLSDGECTICENGTVLNKGLCLSYTTVTGCIEAMNNRCIKCPFWQAPSVDGLYCMNSPVWWVILLAVIGGVVLLIGLILAFFFASLKIMKVQKMKELKRRFNVFKMSKTNLDFVELSDGIMVDKPYVEFCSIEDKVPVDIETQAVLCIGNSNRKVTKVQFSIKTGEEKFELRVCPEMVTLRSGYACEFSLFLTPKFTCKIESTVLIISKNLSTGKESANEFLIKAETVMSTRLDPKDLVDIEQVGEGGFGVVFKGTYKEKLVAIKKMKVFDVSAEGIEDFTREIDMLDKFRSEFIVHFYGAVFVTTKICIVTEFAEFGSLNSMLKKIPSKEVERGLRIKFMFDAARGIQYLHSNNIMHRDIKPDNILIFSMNKGVQVNAKLTDFGSSRNINMLMTNMTFTKGIGTPIYMAPEVLKQEKYTKPADIFSFSITMYECFGWCKAYPMELFRYSWMIAEFVSDNKRMEKSDNITAKEFNLIQDTWSQEAKTRLLIEDVVLRIKDLIE
ncbi:protein serine/threonine kinase, putative [Entamoeba invadens IP1]|uniref:Protein serine/threonine kinase, putative n=1 Tax=Entamoeba invadens IP1 TaxID=370355 RepID=A0A0A1U0Z4_ENTIV|nr:protein serine/threonine kinase, putative [Entamoeba invadens IP1]ELP84568.1 protein serine/threonine kinase, putative [Entamoeba invadens IP1]|eukprot:XP_004183914.1 protein serine/threonine kinase, putative [Entamoeba invadens IP1]